MATETLERRTRVSVYKVGDLEAELPKGTTVNDAFRMVMERNGMPVVDMPTGLEAVVDSRTAAPGAIVDTAGEIDFAPRVTNG